MSRDRSFLPSLLPSPVPPEAAPVENAAACAACEISRRGFVSMATLAALGLAVGACGGDDAPSGGSTPTSPGGGGGGGGGPVPTTLPSGVTRNNNVFTIDLNAANDLTSVGLMVLGGASVPALVVRAAPDTFRAYDARCPHAGSTNLWQVGGGLLQCNNHGSRFNALDGALNTGPATSGLITLATSRSGTTLTVTAG